VVVAFIIILCAFKSEIPDFVIEAVVRIKICAELVAAWRISYSSYGDSDDYRVFEDSCFLNSNLLSN